MGLVVVTPPAEEPITIAEAIAHLRLGDEPEDQALVQSLIAAAREQVELGTRRALVTQSWKLTLDDFPWNGGIRLPKPTLRAVTSVKYLDLAGVQQTLPAPDYVVDTVSVRGRIVPAYGKTWPATRCILNAVEVVFEAGYGAAVAVPEGLKAAIKLILGTLYENREGLIVGTIVADNPAVKALISKYSAPEF